MTKNRKQNWKDVTFKSLRSHLRRLPEPQVPDTLKAKLIDAIPQGRPKVKEYRLKRRPQIWDFGVTAAAAVLIFALMFLVNYGFSVPSQTILADFNDTSLTYPKWDHDSFFDDQNSTCVEKSLPHELK